MFCKANLKRVVIITCILFIFPLMGFNQSVFADSFPDDDDESGKFLILTKGLSSLGEQGTTIQLKASGSQANLDLGIFDGDLGGYWDIRSHGTGHDQSWFTLYADPTMTGSTNAADQVAQWDGSTMLDSGWFNTSISNDSRALTASGEYSYALDVTWKTNNSVDITNAFKLKSNADILSFANSRYGVIAHGHNVWQHIWEGEIEYTMYDGMWQFFLEIPEPVTELNLWNGDFDLANDTDDGNTPDFPPFDYPSNTKAEGANSGVPLDDSPYELFRKEPNVYQFLTGPYPYYDWIAYDYDPSGDQEWELWKISTIDDGTQDVLVDSIPAGIYTWSMYGVDGHNALYLRADYPYGTTAPIPEPATLLLLGPGIAGLFYRRFKRKKV